ncbi:hypothetical protein BC834DRAFT_922720 [Gloeopeniophorella convolvens]|nr:hypothetical protein BC834DRAFT_922720 [Gloeopeniophorella convolvens]
MSLLTPPRSHHDKENCDTRNTHPAYNRVAWSLTNEYHSFETPSRSRRTAASASKKRPVRSILKQTTSYPILPLMLPEKEREVTPEPTEPLSDLHYLDGPVNTILSDGSTLADLIEAYSILTARLRSAVQESTDADCSWPLFQPLRKNRAAFVDAVVRDLGRALVDPLEGAEEPDSPIAEPRSCLPSPQKSPRKKRCGMNEEQVKFARDLATASHAVIKLLGLAFTLPAVYGVFEDQELGAMVTQALAIPLATELPTPNARKTCALAIWLLQSLRLPADVLVPAKDRIAYALRRAVEGELGKEGKKGSVSDGLKAIHDLSLHEPTIFVPAFAELLPSVIENLLAPRLTLRTQACNALGGLALAMSQVPLSSVHTRLSDVAVTALTAPPATSPTTPGTPTRTDSMLVKTLRTTLTTQDPTCAAQGPVWALCTLAALVVLLGPALVTSAKLTAGLKALLALAVRHKKSSVRALACAVWRVLAWAYFRPPLPPDEEDEDEEEEGAKEGARAWTEVEQARRDEFWKVISTLVDMGAGVGAAGAMLAHSPDDARSVSRVIALLQSMVQRGGSMCHDAVEVLCRLRPEPREWDSARLLPPRLFSADPGLLSIDFAALSEEVRPVLKQTPSFATCARSMDGLIKVWRDALTQVCLSSDAELPPELTDAWTGLLRAALRGLQDNASVDGASPDPEDDEDDVQKLAGLAVALMQDILGDPRVQLVPADSAPAPTPGSDADLAPHSRSNAAMKLAVVRALWAHAHAVLPTATLAGAPADALLGWLAEREAVLVQETDVPHDARTQWAALCAEVLMRGSDTSAQQLRAFWGVAQKRTWVWEADVRALVWRTFTERCRELVKGWEEAVVLLCVPFADKDAWEMGSEDVDAWDATLQVCIARALDEGMDTTRMLDRLARTIASTHVPTGGSAARAVELLLAHAAPHAHEAPALLALANDTLASTYPPEHCNKVVAMWLVRTVTRTVDICPRAHLREVVSSVQEGLGVWVADQHKVFTAEEYAFDIVPMYQTVVVCLQSLGAAVDVLEMLGPVLESGFIGRDDKPVAITEAFQDYWDLTFADTAIPKDGWPEPVTACLKACDRAPIEIVKVAVEHNDRTPMLEPAFSWGSSSTVAADDASDSGSDVTEASPELDSPVTLAKKADPPSTPQAAFFASSPQRPSKLATVQREHIFSPLAPAKLDFTAGAASPSTPSRVPMSPIRSLRRVSSGADKENSPPRLPSVLERIAMASAGSPRLGKRRASGTPGDLRPAKRGRTSAVRPLDNSADSSDSEEEREAVMRSLLQPPTPSPAPRLTTTPALSAVPLRARSPSPTPQPSQKRKRKGVFMDAVEVTRQPPRRASLHTSKAAPDPPLPLRRSLRRAKSLIAVADIPKPVPTTPAHRKRQKVLDQHVPSSSPIAALRRARVVVGSDDSMAAEIDDARALLPSSDDDPLPGQVTPHHIFSPAPRRAAALARASAAKAS